jgi:hypothetical protein
MKYVCTAILFVLLAFGSITAQGSSDVLYEGMLNAHAAPANNGGSPGWGMFLNLIAGPNFVTITNMQTASTAGAAVGFTIEFFTRTGNALGGPVGSGPGSSSDGWTSRGVVNVVQGAGGSAGVSEIFDTPLIQLNPGDTVGVAMVFAGVGPRYFGTGTPPLGIYSDNNLTIVTGDARSAPFTPSGSFFSSRELVGTVYYDTTTVPVELTSFTSTVIGNNVELSWTTATELNNSGFAVERKTELTSWDRISFIAGNGTTTEPKSYSFSDQNLKDGKYFYRLKQIDLDGTFKYYDLAEAVDITTPLTFSLSQNYPNPFNPSTNISWQQSASAYTKLVVYDELGTEVAVLVNEEKPAGNYEIEFNASELASGMYYYRLTAGSFIETKKMILIK